MLQTERKVSDKSKGCQGVSGRKSFAFLALHEEVNLAQTKHQGLQLTETRWRGRKEAAHLTGLIVFADIVQVNEPVPSLQDRQLWSWRSRLLCVKSYIYSSKRYKLRQCFFIISTYSYIWIEA